MNTSKLFWGACIVVMCVVACISIYAIFKEPEYKPEPVVMPTNPNPVQQKQVQVPKEPVKEPETAKVDWKEYEKKLQEQRNKEAELYLKSTPNPVTVIKSHQASEDETKRMLARLQAINKEIEGERLVMKLCGEVKDSEMQLAALDALSKIIGLENERKEILKRLETKE